MMYFGPVAEAARGGQSSPSFDLTVGLTVLVITWIGYLRKDDRRKQNIWVLLGVTAICGIFVYSGVAGLLH